MIQKIQDKSMRVEALERKYAGHIILYLVTKAENDIDFGFAMGKPLYIGDMDDMLELSNMEDKYMKNGTNVSLLVSPKTTNGIVQVVKMEVHS